MSQYDFAGVGGARERLGAAGLAKYKSGMAALIREMTLDDYRQILALWKRTEGIGLSESDNEMATAAYLQRNPGMSCVAVGHSDQVIGAVLCGHDGRRGYIHHLAVAAEHRRKGIAKQLLTFCFAGLKRNNIPKCNVFLFCNNHDGHAFWVHHGWAKRADLYLLQKTVSQPSVE